MDTHTSNNNIDGAVDCVTDYINFCKDVVGPVREVRCFPNNKPWITGSIKHLLNQKKAALKAGDRERMRVAQRDLKKVLRQAGEKKRSTIAQEKCGRE